MGRQSTHLKVTYVEDQLNWGSHFFFFFIVMREREKVFNILHASMLYIKATITCSQRSSQNAKLIQPSRQSKGNGFIQTWFCLKGVPDQEWSGKLMFLNNIKLLMELPTPETVQLAAEECNQLLFSSRWY